MPDKEYNLFKDSLCSVRRMHHAMIIKDMKKLQSIAESFVSKYLDSSSVKSESQYPNISY